MTASPRTPGTLILRLSRLVFAAETVSAVFLPALADFQDEVRQRSPSLPRFIVRCRWYWSLSVLLVVVPFSLANLSVADRNGSADTTNGYWLSRLPLMSLFAGAWGWVYAMAPRCGQEFMVATLFGVVVLAWAMRAWNNGHPGVCGICLQEVTLPIPPTNRASLPDRAASRDRCAGGAFRSE